MIKHDKFEEFLQDRHGAQYIGTDDMMPDDFNLWLGDLSVDEWLSYGNMFAVSQERETLQKRIAELLKCLRESKRGK